MGSASAEKRATMFDSSGAEWLELRMNGQVRGRAGDPSSGMFGGVGTHMRETLLEFEKRRFEITIAEKRRRHGQTQATGEDNQRVGESEWTECRQNRVNRERIEQIHAIAQHADEGNWPPLQDGSESVVFTNPAGAYERCRGHRCSEHGWMERDQADRQDSECGGGRPFLRLGRQ